MKSSPIIKAALLAAGLILFGCATTTVDWNQQIGVMTYREAVEELGPPDKAQKLEDGRTIAEWVSRYSDLKPATFVENDFRYQSATDRLNPPAADKQISTLRLTFGTNNLLSAWTKN